MDVNLTAHARLDLACSMTVSSEPSLNSPRPQLILTSNVGVYSPETSTRGQQMRVELPLVEEARASRIRACCIPGQGSLAACVVVKVVHCSEFGAFDH